MRKSIASLLVGLLLVNPYAQAAQRLYFGSSVLSQAFDGAPEQRYQDGTALMRTERKLVLPGRRVPAREVKQDPNDAYGVSYEWIPGEIYDDYRVVQHYKILDRAQYTQTKARAAQTDSGIGMGFLAAVIGAAVGLGAGMGSRYLLKLPMGGAVAIGILAGIGTAAGIGIPLVKSASRAAYHAAYESAMHDPETWTKVSDTSVLTGQFDQEPPLTSPAHPINKQLAQLRKQLAEQEEARRRENRERRGGERGRQIRNWFAVSYRFKTDGYNVHATIGMDPEEFTYVNQRGYVEVRLYAGDQRGQEKRIFKNREYEMTNPRQTLSFPSNKVCNKNNLYPYDRYLKVWVSPRNPDGSAMQDYSQLRAATGRVTCKGAIWEAADLLEDLMEAND